MPDFHSEYILDNRYNYLPMEPKELNKPNELNELKNICPLSN